MLMMMEVSVTSVILILGIFCSASWAQPGLHCFYYSYYRSFQGHVRHAIKRFAVHNDSGELVLSCVPPSCIVPQCDGFLLNKQRDPV